TVSATAPVTAIPAERFRSLFRLSILFLPEEALDLLSGFEALRGISADSRRHSSTFGISVSTMTEAHSISATSSDIPERTTRSAAISFTSLFRDLMYSFMYFDSSIIIAETISDGGFSDTWAD